MLPMRADFGRVAKIYNDTMLKTNKQNQHVLLSPPVYIFNIY